MFGMQMPILKPAKKFIEMQFHFAKKDLTP